jgi:hypothetical protein
MPVVYSELKRIASGYLQGERPGATLQVTALVHDAQLSPRTFCTFPRELSSLRRTISCRRTARSVLEELSGVKERPASGT